MIGFIANEVKEQDETGCVGNQKKCLDILQLDILTREQIHNYKYKVPFFKEATAPPDSSRQLFKGHGGVVGCSFKHSNII